MSCQLLDGFLQIEAIRIPRPVLFQAPVDVCRHETDRYEGRTAS